MGKQKDVQLLQDNQSINIDRWLQKRQPVGTYRPQFLNLLRLLKFQEKSISEWQKFLDEWDLGDHINWEVEILSRRRGTKKPDTSTIGIVLETRNK